MNERRSSTLPRTLSVALALTAPACGTDDDATFQVPVGRTPRAQEAAIDGGLQTPAQRQDAGISPSSAGQTVVRPDGRYRASIQASGTGCAPGTWFPLLKDDGRLVVRFAGFDAQVDKQTTLAVKDCQLVVWLDSAMPSSFQLRSAVARGYAYLEPGVEARIRLLAYFLAPRPPAASCQRVVGPHDDSYEFSSPEDALDRQTPCGTTHRLEAHTAVAVANSTPRREGYVNLAGIDGPDAQLILTLSDRACEQ